MATVYLYDQDMTKIAQKGMHAPKRPGEVMKWYHDACKLLHKELGLDRLAKDKPHCKHRIDDQQIRFSTTDGYLIIVDRSGNALG